MAATARRLGRPRAAQTIAQDLLQLAGVSSPLNPQSSILNPPEENGFVKLTEVA
jgi:hypothetical protein